MAAVFDQCFDFCPNILMYQVTKKYCMSITVVGKLSKLKLTNKITYSDKLF